MRSGKKVGRNDSCPCGSGKKYKNCCLRKPLQTGQKPEHSDMFSSGSRISSETSINFPRFGEDIWNLTRGNKALQAGLGLVEENAANFSRQYCIASRLPTAVMRSKLGAQVIHHLCVELAALQLAYGRRLATTYCDSVDALNRRRLHLASLALRAYVELTGGLLYFEQRITKSLVDGINTQAELDNLSALLRMGLYGGRFDWATFYQSTEAMDRLIQEYADAKSHEHEPTQPIRQISSAAFVSALEKQFSKNWPQQAGKVRAIYAILSDICHPSVGGDLLFTEIPQKPGLIQQRAEPHDEMANDFIRRIALPVLVDISQITFRSLNRVGQIGESLRQRSTSGDLICITFSDDSNR